MAPTKSEAFSLRLPPEMLDALNGIAAATHRSRSAVIVEAVAHYLDAAKQPHSVALASPEGDNRLDKLIGLLETIAGSLSHSPQPVVTRTASLPVTQTATKRHASPAIDPRFVQVEPEADALIIQMTTARAKLADISNALNGAGFVCATGQEWTQSRVRDYRHKLRERGLLNGE